MPQESHLQSGGSYRDLEDIKKQQEELLRAEFQRFNEVQEQDNFQRKLVVTSYDNYSKKYRNNHRNSSIITKRTQGENLEKQNQIIYKKLKDISTRKPFHKSQDFNHLQYRKRMASYKIDN